MRLNIYTLLACLIPLLIYYTTYDKNQDNLPVHQIFDLTEYNRSNVITNENNPVLFGDIIVNPTMKIPYAKLGKQQSNSICRDLLIPKDGFKKRLTKKEIIRLIDLPVSAFNSVEPVHPNDYLKNINYGNAKLYRRTSTNKRVSFGISSIVLIPYLFIFFTLLSLLNFLKSKSRYLKITVLLLGTTLGMYWMFGAYSNYGSFFKWEIVNTLLGIIIIIGILSMLYGLSSSIRRNKHYNFRFTVLIICFLLPTIILLLHRIISLEYLNLHYSIEPKAPWEFHLLNSYFIGISFTLVYALFFFMDHHKKLEDNRKKLQLSHDQSIAQLNSLQARLNPHFLYNGLNSVASLISEHPQKAEEMTLRLSKFLKYFTNRNNEHFTTLKEESGMITEYLEIEKIRFRDKLEFNIDISTESQSILIPRSLLQPIVENAVKYGFHLNDHYTRIKLQSDVRDELLFIRIFDSGKSFDQELHKGFGLKSVYQKLNLLYPDGYDINFINQPDKHVEIKINITKKNSL